MRFNANISKTMDGHGRHIFLFQVFFCLVVFGSTGDTKLDCSQVKCPGPLMYYKDVGCTPVYKNKGDCCAYKYNCDHLNARSPDKCYIQHRSYEIGEKLGTDDKNPCNVGCFCEDTGHFICAIVDCYFGPVEDGCYMKQKPDQCCPGPITCPKNESEIPKCVVDGVTYRDGEFFTLKDDPEKRCTCQEGYEGKNIEPFCIKPKTKCSTDLYHNQDIREKCIPTYYADQNPATNCSAAWRCQNANDTVIPNPSRSASSKKDCSDGKEDMTCKFGNMTLNLGDELSPNTDYTSTCMRCVCEVPPTPTCQRLNDKDCSLAGNLSSRK